MSQLLQNQQSGASSPFISVFESIGNVLSQSANVIGTQVLPVWVADQLDVQRDNQLFSPIRDTRFLPPTLGSPKPPVTVQKVSALTGSTTGDTIAIAGLLALGVIIALKA